MRPADQDMCTGAKSDRNAATGANIMAGERTMMVSTCRCHHRPYHGATRSDAQIKTQPVDVSDVVLWRPANVWSETTSQLLMRSNDQSETG
jgi:hypothetical protein